MISRIKYLTAGMIFFASAVLAADTVPGNPQNLPALLTESLEIDNQSLYLEVDEDQPGINFSAKTTAADMVQGRLIVIQGENEAEGKLKEFLFCRVRQTDQTKRYFCASSQAGSLFAQWTDENGDKVSCDLRKDRDGACTSDLYQKTGAFLNSRLKQLAPHINKFYDQHLVEQNAPCTYQSCLYKGIRITPGWPTFKPESVDFRIEPSDRYDGRYTLKVLCLYEFDITVDGIDLQIDLFPADSNPFLSARDVEIAIHGDDNRYKDGASRAQPYTIRMSHSGDHVVYGEDDHSDERLTCGYLSENSKKDNLIPMKPMTMNAMYLDPTYMNPQPCSQQTREDVDKYIDFFNSKVLTPEVRQKLAREFGH